MSDDERPDGKLRFLEQHHSSTERGVALAVFAYLESKVDACIVGMAKDDAAGKSLLKKTLRNTSAKLHLLYSLGFISDEANSDLLFLKQVRNLFAHEMDVDSFDDLRVRDAMDRLKMTPRTAVYGQGNEHEVYHDEAITAFHGDFSYPGFIFVVICGAYGNLFQANRAKLSSTSQLHGATYRLMTKMF